MVILTTALAFLKIVIMCLPWCVGQVLKVGSLVLPLLVDIYFGEAGRSVCLGNKSRKNYSVGIIKSEFQE